MRTGEKLAGKEKINFLFVENSKVKSVCFRHLLCKRNAVLCILFSCCCTPTTGGWS